MEFDRFKEHIIPFLKDNIPPDLPYHNFDHTIYVFEAGLRIATHEGIDPDELLILNTASLLHDAGFTRSYKDHEEFGAVMAGEILPGFGFSPEQVELVCRLIRSTKIPQAASHPLEMILCDADLDYLGTDDFFPIGGRLYEEFLMHGIVKDEKDWNRLQVKFLEAHNYFTSFARLHRESKKMENLQRVKEIISGYEL